MKMAKMSTRNKCPYKLLSFCLVAGVPYHVRVYSLNEGIRGGYCSTTDFGDQLGKYTTPFRLPFKPNVTSIHSSSKQYSQ